jgi:hypothetical protein
VQVNASVVYVFRLYRKQQALDMCPPDAGLYAASRQPAPQPLKRVEKLPSFEGLKYCAFGDI